MVWVLIFGCNEAAEGSPSIERFLAHCTALHCTAQLRPPTATMRISTCHCGTKMKEGANSQSASPIGISARPQPQPHPQPHPHAPQN